MGTFFFCWAPHFIGMICLLFPSCNWPDAFFATTTWLAMLNSGCNPIIYGVMNKKFRQSFKDILMCRKRTNRNYSHREMSSSSWLLFVGYSCQARSLSITHSNKNGSKTFAGYSILYTPFGFVCILVVMTGVVTWVSGKKKTFLVKTDENLSTLTKVSFVDRR